ncbi:AAA family ATPase [Xanthocytophaga agilis]|uniref:AAA family ATPase n=1 Tax=Xanthocytophaga agilis TaxID=3048010 RepID=A0AAE3R769_9BACT|nr:AAA family ATPase [Xanthocytophaga agilis]MDJ1505121.1 AAA family ATPase [Xanthocytophaga agilis]
MQVKIQDTDNVFGNRYLESRTFFLHTFQKIPCIIWLNQINVEKAYAYIQEIYKDLIQDTFQYSGFNHQKKKVEHSETFIVLSTKCIVELYNNYCKVLYLTENQEVAHQLVQELSKFKEVEKKSEFEINIIVRGSYGLELKSMEVKKTRLNLGLYYEDDFQEIDEHIRKRLNKQKDKGIVLLHGLPGTGKTTYLRYLIGKLKKKVIFVSPDVATNIVNPELIDMLIDNPDCVLIIEDAENVIKDRQADSNSAVSNLLNLTDGLLADCLNVQIICTFNSALSVVDNALLREGRLIAKYEFNKLSVEKSRALSEHLGHNRLISEPMTIAEITNPQAKKFRSKEPFRVIGFQREAV